LSKHSMPRNFKSRFFQQKKMFWSCCALFVVCFLVLGCSHLANRHFRSKLDDLQGTVILDGLKDKVTVSRDDYGIPLVEAQNMEDMAMAVGYVHASDRLTQMIGMKLLSQGRLAEMAGPSVLALDIYMRSVNPASTAEILYKNVSAANRRLLQCYSDGVNAYLKSHQNRLPPGLALSGYKPEPWEPVDSVRVFTLLSLGLSFNFAEEIAILNVAQAIGAKKTAWLSPIYPDESLAFDEAAKLGEINLKMAEAGIRELAELHPILHSLGLGGIAASNNWAISRERTSGKASIFSNDMHLPLSMPSVWNLLHVRCGSYDAAGVSIAGAPVIIAGYNGRVAWGMTMVMADNQDVFLEQIKLVEGRLHYLHKGKWLPVSERREVFRSKGGERKNISIYETLHGTLMSEALRGEPLHLIQAMPVDIPYGIALCRAKPDGNDDSMNAFFQLGFSGSVDEAIAAAKRIRSIPLNMMFADKENIAWQVTGNYPLRAGGRGLAPSPGWTGRYDWTGFLDSSALPYQKNPPQGFLGTANHRTVPKDYPHILSSSWYWPERAERIEQMVLATHQHTAETSMAMQLDTFSLFVSKLRNDVLTGPFAAEIMKESESWQDEKRVSRMRLALEMLRNFRGDMKADSAEAALLGSFLDAVTKNIFLDELGPMDSRAWKSFVILNSESYNATCDHLLVRGNESPFWDDIATPEKETKAGIVARSLADAVLFLESTCAEKPQQWKWGNLHTGTWETDSFQMAKHLGWMERTALKSLWSYFNRGPYPAEGDMFTLNVSMYMMGGDFQAWIIPSMRMVVDFSRKEPMMAVNSSGQSDNPSSPYYDDGVEAWREGRYLPFPFQEENIRAHYRHILILQPSSSAEEKNAI